MMVDRYGKQTFGTGVEDRHWDGKCGTDIDNTHGGEAFEKDMGVR